VTGDGFAIAGRGLEKSFAKKRSVGEILRRPFDRPERVRALRGVDLEVRRGEIFGLLGPNGAGKTTLLKILSCLVLPDRGTVHVDGEDAVREARVKPRIGLVHSDERSFYWRLSGRENLRFFATLYDVPRTRAVGRIEALLRRMDLVEAADRRFSDYSSGMKQRLAVARALLHDPPILLMDEPTRSLDPASAASLRELIRDELRGRDGKTILLATHNLREAEVLCDRMTVLVRGRVRRSGSPAEVRRAADRGPRVRLDVDRWPDGLDGPFVVESVEPRDDGHRVTVAVGDGGLDRLLRAVLGAGARVRSCEPVEPDLETAFARILAEAAAEEARA
jgi:ABC-2 type transport system ATP-binding protein